MKATLLFTIATAVVLGLLIGCSGSDSTPATSSSPSSGAAAQEQRTTQSDALTPAEVNLVNQGESEPIPSPKQDS